VKVLDNILVQTSVSESLEHLLCSCGRLWRRL
jgi:hypothetical protein